RRDRDDAFNGRLAASEEELFDGAIPGADALGDDTAAGGNAERRGAGLEPSVLARFFLLAACDVLAFKVRQRADEFAALRRVGQLGFVGALLLASQRLAQRQELVVAHDLATAHRRARLQRGHALQQLGRFHVVGLFLRDVLLPFAELAT